MFFKGSRYSKVPDASVTDKHGREVQFKRMRFIPKTNAQMGHTVAQGERLDHIAHQYYRDAERFWRICDANEVMKPEELERDVGRIIGIPPTDE